MKLGYVWWVFHRLISINLSNGVLDGSGLTSSTAGLFVGYTVVEFKESLLLSSVSPVVRAPLGQDLRFRSWTRGASGLPMEGLEKEEDCPKWRLV